MTSDGGKTIRRWYLPSRNGGRLQGGVPAALAGDELVYWSGKDRALCVKRAEALPQWFALDAHISTADSVEDVAATPDDILLTLARPDATTYVVVFNRHRRHVAKRSDLACAKVVPCSGRVVVQTIKGVVMEYAGRTLRAKLSKPIQSAAWAFDPVAGSVAAIESGDLSLSPQDAQPLRVVPGGGFFSGVWVIPGRREFLACRQGWFGRTDILSFDYRGASRGCYVSVHEPVGSPVCEPSPGTVRLLDSVSGVSEPPGSSSASVPAAESQPE